MSNHYQALRDRLGLTQTEFWGRVQCTQSAGSRYEGGRAIPKPVQLLLSIAYGRDWQAVVRTLRTKKGRR